MGNNSTGILLLNMGGPDSLEDVPGFLYNLFADREIIRLGPALLQKPLAWLISRRRAPKSKHIYSKIGGGSPLLAITRSQATALEQELRESENCVVEVAMRYWQPSAEQAINALLAKGATRLIALPLYPHYSKATSGSSLADIRRAHAKLAGSLPLVEIPSWPEEPDYIKALAAKITDTKELFSGAPYQLLYSAHSLPVSFITAGDPYVEEISTTISAIEKLTGIAGRLAYQSRSGPVEWLSPDTSEMLNTLAEEGCKNVLMVPISFVSDHVETLYEVDMLFKEQAEGLGMQLVSTPALNTDPLFIHGLVSLVKKAMQGP